MGWPREIRALLAAGRLLTRIPLPDDPTPPSPELLRQAAVYFPLVGCLLGAVGALVLVGADALWGPAVAVLLVVAVEALLTGAFHEDAVADFCDACGGAWDRERTLAILKDSRLGSYGALGLFLAVGLKVAALLALPPGARVAGLVAAASLGRWLMLPATLLAPPRAERPGLAAALAGLSGRQVLVGALLALPGLLPLALVRPGSLPLVAAGLALALLLILPTIRRRLGEVTGDALGTVCYLGQVAVLLAAAL